MNVTANGAAITDGSFFILDDGVNSPVTFEFNSAGAFTQPNREIAILATDTTVDVASKVQVAIQQAILDGDLALLGPTLVGSSVNLATVTANTRALPYGITLESLLRDRSVTETC